MREGLSSANSGLSGLIDNPAAQNIIDLDGPTLETTIENRTAAQETLLLKTLSFAVRFLFESVKLLD